MADNNNEIKCECCNYVAQDMKALNRHQKTDKHIKKSGGTVAVKQTEVQQQLNTMSAILERLLTTLPNPVATKTIKPPPVPAIVKRQRNIDAFLGEECRDAIDLDTFIDNIVCDEKDFEMVGHSNYVSGFSSLLIRELNKFNIHTRPIQCINISKNTCYIKNHGVWIEDVNSSILLKKIAIVVKKVQDLIPAYQTKYSYNIKRDEGRSEDYNGMLIQALGGKHTREHNENAVIKAIMPSVAIDARHYS